MKTQLRFSYEYQVKQLCNMSHNVLWLLNGFSKGFSFLLLWVTISVNTLILQPPASS